MRRGLFALIVLLVATLPGCIFEPPVTLRVAVASDEPHVVAEVRRVLTARFEEFPASMLASFESSVAGSQIQFTFKHGVPERSLLEQLCKRGLLRAVLARGGVTWFTERDLVDAVSTYRDGKPGLAVELTPEAGERVRGFTRRHIGQQLKMSLDGQTLAQATITAAFDRHFQVSFGEDDGVRLPIIATVLRSGSLPAAVTLLPDRPASKR